MTADLRIDHRHVQITCMSYFISSALWWSSGGCWDYS